MAKKPRKPDKLPNLSKLAKKERSLEAQEVKDILNNLQQQVKTMQALGNETKFLKSGFQSVQEKILENLKAIEDSKSASDTFKSITGDLNKISLENLQINIKRAEQYDKLGTSQFREISLQNKIFEITKLKFKIEDEFKSLDEKALKNKIDILKTETQLGKATDELIQTSKKLRPSKGAIKDRVEELRNILKQQKAERTTYANRDIERKVLEQQRKDLEKDFKEAEKKNEMDKKIHDESIKFMKMIMKPVKKLQSLIHKLPGGSIIATLLKVENKDLKTLSNKIGKRFSDSFKKIREEGGTMFDALKDVVPEIAEDLLGWAKSIKIISIAVSTLIVFVGLAFKRFVDIDKITREIRSTTGFTGDNLEMLKKQTVALNLEFQKYGINLKDSAKIMTGLVTTLGSLGAVTKEDAKNVVAISKLFGVSAGEAGKLYGIVIDMAGGNTDIASQTAATVKSLAKQKQVSPQAVFKDLAKNAEFVARFTKDGGKNMVEAAIAARKFGMELSTLTKISDSLLDFETSIRNQLEASFFIGRNLNLDRARYYNFTGNIKELQEELLDQMGSVEEFNNLDIISRQKLAKAIGITTAELLHFLTVQERLNIVADDSLSIQQKLAKGATLGDLLKLDDSVITDLEFLQLSIKNLVVSFGSALLPVIEYLKPLFRALGILINSLATAFQFLGKGVDVILDVLKWLGDLMFPLMSNLEDGGDKFNKFVNILIAGAALIAAAFIISNPFGWIIGIIGLIGLLKTYWDDIKTTFFDFIDWIVEWGKPFYKLFIQPFVDAWNFLFGNTIWSTETIGKVFGGIVNTIKSVGSFILDVLTWPFRKAWDFIKSLFSGGTIGKMLGGAVKWVKNLFGGDDKKIPEIKVEEVPKEIKVDVPSFDMSSVDIKALIEETKNRGGAADLTLIKDYLKTANEYFAISAEEKAHRASIAVELDLPKNIGIDMPEIPELQVEDIPKVVAEIPKIDIPTIVDMPKIVEISQILKTMETTINGIGTIITSIPEIKTETKKVIDEVQKNTEAIKPKIEAEENPDQALNVLIDKLDLIAELLEKPAIINMDGRKVGEGIARRGGV